MYKKVWRTRKIVLLIKPIVFLTFWLRSRCLNSASPVTIPEVFAKANSIQFLFVFCKKHRTRKNFLFHDNTYRNSLLNFLLLWLFLPFSKLNVQKINRIFYFLETISFYHRNDLQCYKQLYNICLFVVWFETWSPCWIKFKNLKTLN